MNIENLQKAVDHLRNNVTESQFNMYQYREGDMLLHECDSVGCIIGHCTVLDDYENIPIIDKVVGSGKKLDFTTWSETFFDLNSESDEWEFMFSDFWSEDEKASTLEQAIKRLEYVINHESVPKDWDCNYEYIVDGKNVNVNMK